MSSTAKPDREMPMDDEAKQLLREIRDIAARCEARDSEWITECRKSHEAGTQRWIESDARNRRTQLYWGIAMWLLLALFVATIGADVYARFYRQAADTVTDREAVPN